MGDQTPRPREPRALEYHAPDYQPLAWDDYTLAELGQWVHLLAKRATQRADRQKRAKDLYDARNYWRMMGAKLDALSDVPELPEDEW